MANERSQATPCPPEVLDWIAWYPEGLLPDATRGRIEAHAAECGRCRDEIAMLRGAAEPDTNDMPDADAVFERVLSRIEAQNTWTGRAPGRAAPAPRRGMFAAVRRHAIAAGLALVLVSAAGGGLVGGWLGRSAPDYRTASASGSSEPRLDLVLGETATFGRIEAGLRAVGGRIVAGPSAGGRVQIALPAGSDLTELAARLRTELGDDALLVEPAVR